MSKVSSEIVSSIADSKSAIISSSVQAVSAARSSTSSFYDGFVIRRYHSAAKKLLPLIVVEDLSDIDEVFVVVLPFKYFLQWLLFLECKYLLKRLSYLLR